MKKYRFSVIIEQDEDGMYVATVPELKGCHTQAKSFAQLEKRIREAIKLCLSVEKGKLNQNKFIGFHELEVAF
ncbi:MAG: type II toxin-antitoxin system HicB family antitoxin [Deltaproteobacteria bacterium]|nr:type II toxin-antitoxin system HicB family antitoxin [Deltaproteobacteria bacterium]